MKKQYFIPLLLLIGFVTLTFSACSSPREQYIRIHIRANSDSVIDQEVKLAVRDSIIALLTPLAKDAENKAHMMRIISTNMGQIKAEADKTLKAQNINYYAEVQLSKEVFPTKKYGDLILQSGEYDALIINLGSGDGGNWWCVAFPPLCFIPAEDNGGEEIVYKSKIAEWINSIFG